MGESSDAAGKRSSGLRLARQMKQALQPRAKGYRTQLRNMLWPLEERLMRMQRLIEQTLHIVQPLEQPQDSQKRHMWIQTYQRQSEWNSRR